MFIVDVSLQINCQAVRSFWFFHVAIGSKKELISKDEIDWYDAKEIGVDGKGWRGT